MCEKESPFKISLTFLVSPSSSKWQKLELVAFQLVGLSRTNLWLSLCVWWGNHLRSLSESKLWTSVESNMSPHLYSAAIPMSALALRRGRHPHSLYPKDILENPSLGKDVIVSILVLFIFDFFLCRGRVQGKSTGRGRGGVAFSAFTPQDASSSSTGICLHVSYKLFHLKKVFSS